MDEVEKIVETVVSTQPEPLNKVNVPFLVSSWKQLMTLGMASAFVERRNDAPVGFLLSLYTPDLLLGTQQATNFLWMVTPGSGVALRLLRQFEREAKERKCSVMVSGSIENSRPKEMAKMYSRLGYEHFSSSFCKKVK